LNQLSIISNIRHRVESPGGEAEVEVVEEEVVEVVGVE
jgi:hypothetical protein